MFLVIKS